MTYLKKHYNKKYFDEWYRQPGRRVSTRNTAMRKAALVVGVTEYYLQRPVRTILDVGCGEGQWQPILKKMRPKIQYTGMDSSTYAVAHFGKKRNLVLGEFNHPPPCVLSGSYDMIICSDILYYLPDLVLEEGLKVLIPRLDGIAFLEAYASDEPLTGDTQNMLKRSTLMYQRLFKNLGLQSCGSHCYASPSLSGQVTTLEQGSASPV